MCDASPAIGDDGGQFVLERAELERIISLSGAGMVRFGGNQVAAGDQLVALDGGVVAKCPTYLLSDLAPKGRGFVSSLETC
jgi:hypothetical protein